MHGGLWWDAVGCMVGCGGGSPETTATTIIRAQAHILAVYTPIHMRVRLTSPPAPPPHPPPRALHASHAPPTRPPATSPCTRGTRTAMAAGQRCAQGEEEECRDGEGPWGGAFVWVCRSSARYGSTGVRPCTGMCPPTSPPTPHPLTRPAAPASVPPSPSRAQGTWWMVGRHGWWHRHLLQPGQRNKLGMGHVSARAPTCACVYAHMCVHARVCRGIASGPPAALQHRSCDGIACCRGTAVMSCRRHNVAYATTMHLAWSPLPACTTDPAAARPRTCTPASASAAPASAAGVGQPAAGRLRETQHLPVERPLELAHCGQV